LHQKSVAIKPLKKGQVSQIVQTVSAWNRFFKRAFEKKRFTAETVCKNKGFGNISGTFTGVLQCFFWNHNKTAARMWKVRLWAQNFEFHLRTRSVFDEHAQKII
jgi:hypothetical protein